MQKPQHPIEIVTTFFDMWGKGKDALRASLYEYLAPDAVWENVGLGKTTGVDEAVAAFFSFPPAQLCDRIEVDMLNIVAEGNLVFTERLDRVVDAEGNTFMPVRAVGVLEIENGKIKAWRDYFDTLPFAAASK